MPLMDYRKLDGLRGIAASAVYLTHVHDLFYGSRGLKPPPFLDWIRQSVFVIFLNGRFWVTVFFILSGFVLPISFLKSKKRTSLVGAVMRRYPRLGLPTYVVNTLVYLCVKLGLTT